MKKIWILVIAVIIVAGAGFWSYKAGVWTNVVQKKSGSVSYKGVEGKTALELLKSSHKVETQNFSGGEFVKTIDGIAPTSAQYWAFTVNGAESTVGAGQYITKDTDTIEWQLKDINNKL